MQKQYLNPQDQAPGKKSVIPNAETMAVIAAARKGEELHPIDVSSFEAFIASVFDEG